jgi:NAD(P)-dependent dehydrogenase (short-subunit alcohol dehydrogenase family)
MITQQPIHSGFYDTSTASQVIAGIDLNGKTIVITGGHSGIGLETTKILSEAGATIIVGARNIAKARQALAGAKKVNIIELDLSEPVSVNEFTNEYRKSFDRCDMLINNAGIMATPLLRNSLGYELQFATNHLGHFQLTANLWNELCKSRARVICLSSLGHRFSGIQFDDPNFNLHPYEKWKAYGQSKTANSLFAVHLDKIGKEYGVRAFAVHPGRITSTHLNRFMSDEEKATATSGASTIPNYVPSLIKSIAQGAATTIWCATSPELENTGGVYCADCDISPIVEDDSPQVNGVRRWAISPAMAEQLWTLSEKLTGLDWPK